MDEEELLPPPPPKKAELPPPPPKKSIFNTVGEYIGMFNRDVTKTLTSTPLKFGGAIDETLVGGPIQRAIYGPQAKYKSWLTSAGEGIEKGIDVAAPVSDEVQQSFGGQVMGGLGTGAAMMVTGGVSNLIKGGAALEAAIPTTGKIVAGALTSPTVILGGAMTAVPEYEAAKEAGLPEDQLFGVLAKNYLVGQTEALPIQRLFGRLNNLTGGNIYKKILKVGTASGIGAFEEATQEGIQTYLSNQIAREEYDPDRDPLWGIARAMTVGGVVGAILPGIGMTMQHADPTEKAKIGKKLQELASLEQAVQTVNEGITQAQAGEQTNQTVDQSAGLTKEEFNTVQDNNVAKAEAEGALVEEEQEAERQKQAEKDAKTDAKTERSTTQDNTSTSPQSEGSPDVSTEGASERQGPSVEYTQADEAYQAKVTELKASPDVEIGPKGLTPLNEKGAAQVKELTDLWQARDNVRIAEEKTVKKREPKTVHTTPGQALKEQVITFYKGVQKGVKKGAELKNQLVTKVQEAIKALPLTPRQVSTIMTRVKATNLFTAGSVSRLNDFIGKVGDDALYAEKVAKAVDLRKQIKKKGRSEKLPWQEKQAMKQFAAIDPEYVDLDTYLGHAESINNNLLRPAKERTTVDLTTVNDYLKTVPDTEKLKEQERQERLAESLGLTMEEAQHLLEQDVPESSAEKKVAVKTELTEIAEQAKNEMHDKWESGELDGATKKEMEAIEAMKSIDLSLLTADQLRSYVRTVDSIVTNEVFANAGHFTAIAKAQQDFKELLKIGKKWNILNLNGLESAIDSLPMAIQAIVGLPKDAALFQLYMGIKGVSDASVRAVNAEEDFVGKVNELRKKNKTAFTNDSILRQGIYGELIRYQEGEDPTQSFADNKAAIEQTIENHRNAGEVDEANLLTKLYVPLKHAQSIDDAIQIMAKIDPAGKKVIDFAIEYFKPFAERVVEYNNLYFNKPTVRGVNYSGPRRWRKKGTGLDEVEGLSELNLDSGPSISSTAKPKQTSSAKEFSGQQRTDAVLDFNKHNNMANSVRKVMFDTEAVGPMLQVRENMKRPELPELFGKGKSPEQTRKATDLYEKIFGKQGAYFSFEDSASTRKVPDAFDQKTAKWLNPFRKLGYTLSLSGLSQIPKQATVLANLAVNLGSDFDLISTREVLNEKKALLDFLSGETVSMRGAQKSGFSLGEVTGGKTEKDTDSLLEKLDEGIQSGFEGWFGIKPLVKTDVAVAKMTYLAFYKQYLRQNRIKYEGLVNENKLRGTKERQEARAYAKQKTDVLQVVSNPHELGRIIKDQSTGWQIAKALLIPYGTFSSNAKSRMWSDWRAIKNGSPQQRAAGARDLFATAVEQGTFHTVSAALKIYVWSTFGQLIAGAFDLPDDKDRDEKTWTAAVNTWKTNLIIDLLPLILTEPGENSIIAGVNAASERLFNYKDPLYKYSGDVEDPLFWISTIAGPYGVPFERLGRQGAATVEAVSGERRGAELTPEQRRFAMLVSVLSFAQFAGKVPADVMFAIDKELKRQKPGQKLKETPTKQYLK